MFCDNNRRSQNIQSLMDLVSAFDNSQSKLYFEFICHNCHIYSLIALTLFAKTLYVCFLTSCEH